MDNLHYIFDLEYNPSCVILWAGMTDSFDGTHFFVGPVHGAAHAETVEIWFIPQLRYRGIMEDVLEWWSNWTFVITVWLLFQTAWLAMAHQHLPYNYPDRHVVLILPHWIFLGETLWRAKWLHTFVAAVMFVQSCETCTNIMSDCCVRCCINRSIHDTHFSNELLSYRPTTTHVVGYF